VAGENDVGPGTGLLIAFPQRRLRRSVLVEEIRRGCMTKAADLPVYFAERTGWKIPKKLLVRR